MDPLFHIGNRLYRGTDLKLTVEAARQNFSLLSAKNESLIARPEATLQDIVSFDGATTVVVTPPNNSAFFGSPTVQRFVRWTLVPGVSGVNVPTLFSERWFCPQEFAVVGQAVGIMFASGRVTGLYPAEVQGKSYASENQFRTAAVLILPGTAPLLPA